MRNYLLILSILAVNCSLISAQGNIIENGDFEEQGIWKVAQHIPEAPVNVEFGSTAYDVKGGNGGNLLISHETVTEEQVFVYQAVELEADKEYIFSLAMHDVSAEHGCWWVSLFYSDVEPTDGSDITETQIVQIDEWHDDFITYFDEFNGLLDTMQTEQGVRIDDTLFTIPADGTYYIGINFGGCSSTGNYTFVFDELKILDPDLDPVNISSTGIINELSLYPNPASNNIEFSYNLGQSTNIEITIYNSLGQTMRTINDGAKLTGIHKRSFNCSYLANGLYYCVIKTDNNSIVKKIVISK